MSEFQHIGKQISQIVEGHTNKALSKVGLLSDDIEKLSEERFSYCLACAFTPRPNNPNKMGPGLTEANRCDSSKGGCNCDMVAKTKVEDATCPIGRW